MASGRLLVGGVSHGSYAFWIGTTVFGWVAALGFGVGVRLTVRPDRKQRYAKAAWSLLAMGFLCFGRAMLLRH